jgi:hypothetical protein
LSNSKLIVQLICFFPFNNGQPDLLDVTIHSSLTQARLHQETLHRGSTAEYAVRQKHYIRGSSVSKQIPTHLRQTKFIHVALEALSGFSKNLRGILLTLAGQWELHLSIPRPIAYNFM